ncbi:unnamed protein product [Rotaria magnacalcarata]|nr:unnamed protein product [Rotaria magnacalcarata]CAF1601712.1 unnamed protein product [Rotaria magnacalcarata]CAF2154878.1 unnamed protein product [Rotaria magnacalcarata]CAF3842906.1 unnamed protein product [Rotaria magnacalcarata]CAF3873571.1 unnamed protein product [Rotaria magnacalcarata]
MELSNTRLGLSQAWPLLTLGLASLAGVIAVTILMILLCVILPAKRRHRVPTEEAHHFQDDFQAESKH